MLQPAISHRHDVVIVGARAAGAATALLLGRLGYDVVLVDRAEFPADTVSTHQLARTGVVALHRWGLLEPVLAGGAPAIRQVTFSAAGESVTRQIKLKSGVDLLVAPRRYLLDTLMAEAAAGAGVDVRMGLTVGGVCLDDAGRAVGVYGRDRAGHPVEIAARYVVGADGLGSRVARSVGAEVVEHRGDRTAVHYAYVAGVPWTGIELIVAERALAGVFPTHHGEACVWICTPTADARMARRAADSRAAAFGAQLRRAAPDLAARIRAGHRTSAVIAMLRLPNLRRQAFGPGWALVGDAGYHRDPITGYGLSDAYRDAELLATALDQVLCGERDELGALAGYQRCRDVASQEIFDLTCALADYPAVPEFIELQKELGHAIDRDAAALAARPNPSERELART